jgi:hypothetical protein
MEKRDPVISTGKGAEKLNRRFCNIRRPLQVASDANVSLHEKHAIIAVGGRMGALSGRFRLIWQIMGATSALNKMTGMIRVGQPLREAI